MKNIYEDEKAIIEIPYNRDSLSIGDSLNISPQKRNISKYLKEVDEIVISLYWKPLGDSFLFLSVAQAAYDYLCALKRQHKVIFVLDSKFSDLLKRIPFLREAKVVSSGIDYFKNEYRQNKKIFLITDVDPFGVDEDVPIFNSEEYKYPRFITAKMNNEQGKIYSSRPSRYYLTFEREVGLKLRDPNNSIPFFILDKNKILEQEIKKSYKLDFKREIFITLINQTSKVEKKFGLLKFLKIAKYSFKNNLVDKVIFLINPNEESPEVWIKFLKEIKKYSDKIILYPYESDNFIELAYILCRSKLVMGNDTGFSHLASMCKPDINQGNPPVYIIYSKHDYTKWTTGYSTPISTKLADYLAKNNMSVRREKINQEIWGEEAFAYSIPIKKVLRETKLLIK